MGELQPVRRLEPTDDLSSFDSGELALDEWFRRFALSDQEADSSVTYVLQRDGRVVGFYTICPSSVGPFEETTRLTKGLPQLRPVSALLIARLARDRSESGKGLGIDLLRDALLRCISGAEIIGGRAVLVEAKHEKAVSFYMEHGFEPLPDNPLFLYRLMKDIRASLP